MEIVLWILIVILGLVALYYRSKAKEFESLFELSKGYSTRTTIYLPRQVIKSVLWTDSITSPKLNKDGSIAKKRGRKSNVKTT